MRNAKCVTCCVAVTDVTSYFPSRKSHVSTDVTAAGLMTLDTLIKVEKHIRA
jgi:hypothetical protein